MGIVVGILHPGEMGAAMGRSLVDKGNTVLWASEGRGPTTADRARAAGLTDAGTAKAVVEQAEILFSICPPHAALDVGRAVAAAGFRGLYVDANAVSPATAREVMSIVGSDFVDGGIIGGPPASCGDTRLYLSGERATEVADLFAGSLFDVRVVPGEPGAASALKMAYAAWSKGTSALVLAIRVLARAEGIEDTLLAEWAISQPGLRARSERAAYSAATKGWRWVAEMEEIAATMIADGLPGGFHQAAAEIYRRSGDSPDLDTVLTSIRSQPVQQPTRRSDR
jgi:3-hydroxyisobutyrate dehydrogenase-like beta-hydroxyacid dehydrogenase